MTTRRVLATGCRRARWRDPLSRHCDAEAFVGGDEVIVVLRGVGEFDLNRPDAARAATSIRGEGQATRSKRYANGVLV